MRKTGLLVLLITIGIACSDDKSVVPTSELEIKSPEEVGMSSSLTSELLEKAKNSFFMYSLVIIKDDALIVNEYFHGANKDAKLHLRSVTKSISSILIGQALEDGTISGLDEKVVAYYPEYIADNRNDLISKVTLSHIIDMKAGFDWNENAESFNWDLTIRDPWDYFFKKEVTTPPGTRYNYNSGAVSLLNRFIEKNQELDFQSYASKKLFAPLQIDEYDWEKDGNNNYRADGGLQLRALDLAMVGNLLINKGVINGETIIPNSWIDESWSFDTPLHYDYVSLKDLHYNNLWYMGYFENHEAFLAYGYGGQFLFCVPDFNLVIVANHDHNVRPELSYSHSIKFMTEIFTPLMEQLTRN